MLFCFTFSLTFVDWVHVLLQSAQISVLLNCTLHGLFSCLYGVCQENLLSPLLLYITDEAFNRNLNFLYSVGQITSIPAMWGCCPLTHVLYADNLLIFYADNLHSLRDFLNMYCRASVQFVNANKNTFLSWVNISHRMTSVSRHLVFRLGVAPLTYLGVLIFRSKTRKIHF